MQAGTISLGRGITDRGNKHDHEILYAKIISRLQELCAQEIDAIDAKTIDPNKPFYYFNSHWIKHLKLRKNILL